MQWKQVQNRRVSDFGYSVDSAVIQTVVGNEERFGAWTPDGKLISVHRDPLEAEAHCDWHKVLSDKRAALKAGDQVEA